MEVEKVVEKDTNEIIKEKDAVIADLQEHIKVLTESLNERDLTIYNLALKIAKL